VIRFSAALVAVAIGVLIGGIATSELLLVYIAIVASAVALVALAIGVVLKREELFGEGQVLVPAGAGASPVLPVRAGESGGQSQPGAPAAPPVPYQGAAAGYGAAFGGTASAASPGAAASTAAAQAAAGQGRSAAQASPWEAAAARDPWSTSAPDTRTAWMPAGHDERTASGVGSAGSRPLSAWPDTAQGTAPGGWGVPDVGAQAATSAPRSWAAPPTTSASPDVPAVKPGAGSGSPPPNWFDRLGSPAGADAPAASPAPAPWADTAAAGTAAAGDEDDDWPTRYSWLDDEADESSEAGEDEAAGTIAADVAGAGPERGSPAAAASGDAQGTDIATQQASVPTAPAVADDAAPGDRPPPRRASPAADTPAADTPATPLADAGEPDAGEDAAMFADPRDAGQFSTISDPGPEPADTAPEETAEAGSGPAAATADSAPGDSAPGTSLVTVVRGVPRYHEPDCVLIRFMPEGDVQQLPIPEAKELGCTPCGACQPQQ